jgi:hypothetical protein
MFFFLPRLADFLASFYFAHFLSSDLCFHWLTKNKHCLWLVGPKNISASTIVILTTTEAVKENLYIYISR